MKKCLAMALAVMLALSLGGASAWAEEGQVDRNIIGDGKRVVSISFDGEAFSREALTDVLTKFYEETGISTELMFVSSTGGWAGYLSKLQTMIAGGDTPDIIRIAIEGFEVFRNEGLLEPLNAYEEKYPEWAAMVADNHEKLVAPLTVDGVTYAYGFEWNNVVTHINKNILAEAGLDMPPADWDYDEFLRYAKAMTFKRDDGAQVYGCNVSSGYFETSAWLFNNGAAILNDDMTECVINSPEAIETIQFLHDLIYVHKVAPVDAGEFLSDQVGMQFAGRWPMKGYNESGFKSVDLQYLPTNKKQQVISGFGMFPISTASENKDDAYKLICWLSSPDSQRRIIDISGIPMSKTVMKEVVVDTDWPTNSRVFYDGADTARSVQAPVAYGDIQLIVNRYLSLIYADEMPVDEALNAAKAEIDLVLMEY